MINAACVPPCKACRDAGKCATQEEIEYKAAHRRAPYWPDSLAGKVMVCGCRVDIIPTVLGRLGASQVWCGTHGWQPLTEEEQKADEKRETKMLF